MQQRSLLQTSGLICGVDEAGRGPLAGCVVAAAVILDPTKPILGLNDSKKLSAKKREELAILIRQNALAFAVCEASVAEIDDINILQASLLAMARAVCALKISPTHALIDGNKCPKNLPCTSEAIIGGDAKYAAIAAASILAKTVRDGQMLEMDKIYPHYGFAKHMGYPTKLHLAMLEKHGICPIHRKSYAPVARLLLK